MRLTATAIACATLVVAAPAFARDNAWYVGVEGGAMIVPEIKFDIAGQKNQADASFNTGYEIDGIVGYDFGAFRLEANVGYREARIKNYGSNVLIPIAGGFSPPGLYSAAGRTSALSFMVNGLVDFGDEAGLSGFVGGGVGAAKVKFSDLTIDRKVPFLEAEGTVFAGELLTGARLPVTDNVELDLKYRYFLTSQISKVNLTGNLQRAGFQSHSILAGLTYNFGGPPTPPPPPPPPPPPSAAPAENPNPTAPVM